MDNSFKRSLLRGIPKIAFGSASVLAALYVGLSPRLATGMYQKRLFRPFPFPEGDWDVEQLNGIKREDVYFLAADGSRLHGWMFRQPDAQYIAHYSHGNTGNITGRMRTIEMLLKAGLSVFIYDFRGYGRSEGKPSLTGICEDGVGAFDYLVKERGYKPSQVVLYGESMGTAVTAEVAAERPCAGIILQSGFSSLRRIGIEHMPLTKIYPRFMFPAPLLDCAERMSRDPRPLLIIHGHKDIVVPFAHAQEIYDRAAHPKAMLELPEAAHSDIWATAPDKYVQAVYDFVSSLAASQRH